MNSGCDPLALLNAPVGVLNEMDKMINRAVERANRKR